MWGGAHIKMRINMRRPEALLVAAPTADAAGPEGRPVQPVAVPAFERYGSRTVLRLV